MLFISEKVFRELMETLKIVSFIPNQCKNAVKILIQLIYLFAFLIFLFKVSYTRDSAQFFFGVCIV